MTACLENDVSMVKSLLKTIDPNECSSTFNVYTTVLSAVSYRNNVEIARILLDNGADVNLKPKEEFYTALCIACGHQSKSLVELFIERGAYVNMTSANRSPLWYCSAYCKNTEIAEILIKNGANMDFVDIHGDSALCKACRSENYEMVKLLLDNGANPFVNIGSSREKELNLILNARTIWKPLFHKHFPEQERLKIQEIVKCCYKCFLGKLPREILFSIFRKICEPIKRANKHLVKYSLL
jgi:ankyrin repeat protein